MKTERFTVSRNALFFRCGYSPDLLAALQVNLNRPTPFFASVATLAVLAVDEKLFYCSLFIKVILLYVNFQRFYN